MWCSVYQADSSFQTFLILVEQLVFLNSSGVFRQISCACIVGFISVKYFRVDWKTWLETLITCLHWRFPCSELQVAWPGPKRPTHPTSEGLARALEAPEMTSFWWDFFSKMEKFHLLCNSWLLCLLCFSCDGSRRFVVTAAPNSQRIIQIRPSNCLLYDIAIIPYDPWILCDDVCSCFFSLHVGKVWLERFRNGQPNVSEIDWNMCSLAQALWKSLTSRARWRALWKAGDKTDCKAFPYSLS